MRILIPTQLRSYTGGAPVVAASGSTLAAALDHLNASFPGIRFRIVDEQDRIRTHIRVFVNGEAAPDLTLRLTEADEVQIVGALSGG